MVSYLVRRLSAEDWREYKQIRLEALKDTPIGFGEWYEDAASKPDAEWVSQTRRAAEAEQSAIFAALDREGRFVGTAGVYTKPGPDPATGRELVVFGVYVTPGHRGAGKGVAVLLFDTAIRWAREVGGARTVPLSVHEHNQRAHAFYRRYGFVDTGSTKPYVLDESASLIEMRYKG